MAAVWDGHEEIALKLIEAGATPDIQDNVSQRNNLKLLPHSYWPHAKYSYWVLVVPPTSM